TRWRARWRPAAPASGTQYQPTRARAGAGCRGSAPKRRRRCRGYGRLRACISPEDRDDAMQSFGGRRLVLHHGDADIVRARIGAIGLLAGEIAARHHADAGFRPQPLSHRLAAAERRYIEPEEEA